MTSSRKNNWDEVMDGVNKALPAKDADNHGVENPSGAIENIYARIADNLDRVKNMLNGEKAVEYGNPRIMCRNISQRWFGCDDAGTEVALMMAELKIERIKYDPSKEDSYLDAIAYLTMALSFMQDGGEQ
ncbi:hypothetical protein BA720P3_00031 [Bifidobacterium phage BA720P3]|nr:hypothetical protein BA720P3_00031 [Bifidobacterium phage BA720P3]WAX05552.1 hypothetical protein BA746P1_00031 [Bifidobacterium phage BA746P1]